MRRGFWHTLRGPNHVLFLVRLVLPVRRLRPLVLIVSVFTAANSVTLVTSAMRFAPSSRWFPPLVESLIATPTLFKAIESADGTGRRRSLMALGFGLVHGFGFPFALSESLRFAEAHVVTSLLAFTFGVDLGQFSVLSVLVPALAGTSRVARAAPRIFVLWTIAPHETWHWILAPIAGLKRFPAPLSTLTIGGP